MRQLIIHIPHASIRIPIRDGYMIDENLIEQELKKLTDWYTDDLFHTPTDISITADFSRIFCDPERFSDDEEEVMAKFGMGVLYDQTDSGLKMRRIDDKLRERILNDYYWPHHEKLNSAVKKQLDHFNYAFIVDCHSFSDTPFKRDLDKRLDRPDINIGTDSYHTPELISDFTISFFNNAGMSVGLNWPYSGTIVPMDYYRTNNKVNSIMIEINRKLYLDPITLEKTGNYAHVKDVVYNYLVEIKRFTQL